MAHGLRLCGFLVLAAPDTERGSKRTSGLPIGTPYDTPAITAQPKCLIDLTV